MTLIRALVSFVGGLAMMLAAPAMADPSAAELAAAKAAEARGAEMYAYDQAAWYSTDAMRDELGKHGKSMEDIATEGMVGFVVEPANESLLLVTYFGKRDGTNFAMARYWMRGKIVVRGGLLKPKDDATLSPLALKLVEIRSKLIDAVIADDGMFCSRNRPNTVILPPRADGTIPAYMMTPQVRSGTFPAGGHHLYIFDAQGKVLSHRTFAKSCLLIDWRSLPSDAAGYGVSHMLDPQPTEIHVFISLMMPNPLFVITDQNHALWQVDKGKITFKQAMNGDNSGPAKP